MRRSRPPDRRETTAPRSRGLQSQVLVRRVRHHVEHSVARRWRRRRRQLDAEEEATALSVISCTSELTQCQGSEAPLQQRQETDCGLHMETGSDEKSKPTSSGSSHAGRAPGCGRQAREAVAVVLGAVRGGQDPGQGGGEECWSLRVASVAASSCCRLGSPARRVAARCLRSRFPSLLVRRRVHHHTSGHLLMDLSVTSPWWRKWVTGTIFDPPSRRVTSVKT